MLYTTIFKGVGHYADRNGSFEKVERNGKALDSIQMTEQLNPFERRLIPMSASNKRGTYLGLRVFCGLFSIKLERKLHI